MILDIHNRIALGKYPELKKEMRGKKKVLDARGNIIDHFKFPGLHYINRVA